MSARTRFQALLLAWVLLIPIVYLGASGQTRNSAAGLAVVLPATCLGLLCVALAGQRRALEGAEAGLARLAPALLCLVCGIYAVGSVVAARDAYARFSPDLNQLGIFSQSVASTLRGHAFANTHETVDGTLGSHFGVHFSPTLLLFVPLYALWPSPMLLMCGQALAVALAPVPLFLLLRRRAGDAAALVLALGLFLLPPFARAGYYDFHDATFLPVLTLFALWALENRRRGLFLLFSGLALGVREDAGLLWVGLGLYAFLRGLGWRAAVGTAALGAMWLIVAVRLCMPHFTSAGLWMDPERFFSSNVGAWGATPAAAAANILAHPAEFLRTLTGGERAHFFYALYRPVLFLPALAHPAWIVSLLILAPTYVSQNDWMRSPIKYHALMPLLLAYLSTARAAVEMGHAARRLGETAVLFGAALVVVLGALPALPLTPVPPPRACPPLAASQGVLRVLPADAAVYATIGLYPHLAGSDQVGCWESVGARARDAGFRSRYEWMVLWPAGNANDAPLAAAVAADPRFRRIAGFEPLEVYRRN